jgi:hypothetical protein
MGQQVGPLLATLATRILHNLDMDSMAPPSGSDRQDEPPFSDTQLLISLLGVLIFPHEAAPEALGQPLRGYEDTAGTDCRLFAATWRPHRDRRRGRRNRPD